VAQIYNVKDKEHQRFQYYSDCYNILKKGE